MAPSEVFAQCQFIILHDNHLLRSRAIEVGIFMFGLSYTNVRFRSNGRSRIAEERQKFLLLETLSILRGTVSLISYLKPAIFLNIPKQT